jgi:flagellar biosynthetic protein FliR
MKQFVKKLFGIDKIEAQAERSLAIAAEATAGLAIGLATQIGFAAAIAAGETISNAMGLGFASMADPASGQSSPAVGQFLSMLTMFLFLAADGHLALIATIAESYRTLPPGGAWLSFSAIGNIVAFGSLAFSAGLSIALPVGFALVLVQLILALLTPKYQTVAQPRLPNVLVFIR